MIESSNFRQINEIEKDLISKSLSHISPKIFQNLMGSKKKLYISIIESNLKTQYPKIYLLSQDFHKKIDQFEFKNKIYSTGLYFGFIKKGNFYFSLEGAEFLYKQGILSDLKFLYLNKKGEKSVLYGNNILKNMVMKKSSNLQKGDFLLIFNNLNEILSIAQSTVDSKVLKNLNPKDIIAINLRDKGIYLREHQ